MIEHLTIKQARNELEKLENELDLYLTKKKINFERTQPGAIKYKDIVTNSSVVFDKFTHYMIKDEKVDSEIFSIQKSIVAYQEFLIKEMERISRYSGEKLQVVLLRDDPEYTRENGKPRTFMQIGEMLGYSEKQVRRIYKELTES